MADIVDIRIIRMGWGYVSAVYNYTINKYLNINH